MPENGEPSDIVIDIDAIWAPESVLSGSETEGGVTVIETGVGRDGGGAVTVIVKLSDTESGVGVAATFTEYLP